MAPRQASPTGLLILLSAAVPDHALRVMLGPLLVALAHEFQTSVALVGQFAAATAITWGITAPLAGPVSDAYGRRRMLLTGLLLMAWGILGAVLAWNYGSLLACRLLTGVGAAMVPPNSIAMVAEVFPPTGRGKAIGWLLSTTGVGAAWGATGRLLAWGGRVETPVCRGGHGVAGRLAPLLGLVPSTSAAAGPGPGVLCPLPGGRRTRHGLVPARRQRPAANSLVWHVQLPGGLSHADLPDDRRRHRAATGPGRSGPHRGGLPGGRVADHRHRLAWFAMACLGSGLLAALVFTAQVSPWATVVLACGTAGLARISSAVTPTLLLERAGRSRTTATGLFAMSNQLGAFGGASLGGLMLALGGFPLVGLFCLGVSVIAAVVIRLKVRDSAAALEQMAGSGEAPPPREGAVSPIDTCPTVSGSFSGESLPYFTLAYKISPFHRGSL